MSDEKKNYGIELLRLMSMFYVVIIHILMRGGGYLNLRMVLNMRLPIY